MIKKLSTSLFILISMILIGSALMPLARYALNIDSSIGMSIFTCTVLLIGGLMAGLTGMILLARRQGSLPTHYDDNFVASKSYLILIHASGLLLYTGIPLANFLVCFYLWARKREMSEAVDEHGVAALNFQITIYLYLLLSLFLVFIIFGLFSTLLILALHFICTVIATIQAMRGKVFKYPANIPNINGREQSS